MPAFRQFRIQAPCSTANIGPGFDVLGISLSMYLTLDVKVNDPQQTDSYVMTCSGEGAANVSKDPKENLITSTALYVLHCNGIQELPEPLSINVHNDIPLGRGLGSSGAAIVAGVLLGNALGDLGLTKDRLLDYCLMIERHPDNVAAALLGGFIASYLREYDQDDLSRIPDLDALLSFYIAPPSNVGHYIRLSWAKEVKAIAIVPQFEVPTVKARAVLPTTYDRKDVVFNFQRLAVLTTALGRSPPDASLIYNAMQDQIHHPYRQTLVPGMPAILSSMTPETHDGLLGICLSGAGPTILALATHNFDAIATAAQEIFKQHGVNESFYRVLDIVQDGATCQDM